MRVRNQSLRPLFAPDGAIIGYIQKGNRKGLVAYDQNFEVIGGANTPKRAHTLAITHAAAPMTFQVAPRLPLAEPPRARTIDYRRPTDPIGSRSKVSQSH
jgi:hypothetical protein